MRRNLKETLPWLSRDEGCQTQLLVGKEGGRCNYSIKSGQVGPICLTYRQWGWLPVISPLNCSQLIAELIKLVGGVAISRLPAVA